LSLQITITMSKSVYSPKVLELVAREVAGHFTGGEIVQILTQFGMTRDDIQYPNTKWWTINEAFKYIKANHEDPETSISKLIMDFLHPLNHNLNEEISEALADKVEKYLKYDNFYIQNTGTEYLIFDKEEMDDLYSTPPEWEEQDKENKELNGEKIKQNKEVIRKLRDSHQAYIDVIELFCRNPKRPTKELNDAYLFLSKKIDAVIKELNLGYYGVSFYKPFNNDLYSAEIEWNGSGRIDDIRLGPTLSWDAIRPSLYRAHSGILRVQSISEEDTQMTDDEKKLEEINSLISQKRTPVPPPVVLRERQKTMKIEIEKMPELQFRNMDDNNSTKEQFYITKNGDDFSYKGRYVNLSKKSDYYKVFSALYAKLPSGGEVLYKDLIVEIKSRLPKTQDKTDDEMKKFIQRNLTDKSNGFMRYAGIPQTEDNSKPLIEVVRGSGVVFNNKAG